MVSFEKIPRKYFFDLQETSLNFPVKSKALRAGSHCGGGERKAQALISFGVARKRENVPYFLAIREMSGGQEMVQIKMFFPAKQNLFSRKGS